MKKLLIPIGLLLFASCYNDKESELYPSSGSCDTSAVTYTTDIQPILSQYCANANCHDAATKSFGHDLSSYSGAVTAANSGRLLGSIKHETGFQQMPKGMQKLGDCEISKVSAWINQGTKQ